VTVPAEFESKFDALHIERRGTPIAEAAVQGGSGPMLFPTKYEFQIPGGKAVCTAVQRVFANLEDRLASPPKAGRDPYWVDSRLGSIVG
jgi:hypothetical protein